MSEWYPIMLKLEGRKCVVVGGGLVAERKTMGLLQAKADVVIVSPQVTSTISQWAETGQLTLINREVQSDDLDGAVLLFAATDRQDINRWIAQLAEERGILVNLADAGERGEFLTPAVIRRGGLVLTASASGAGPALAARIIRELGEQYGPEYEQSIEVLRKIRTIVQAEVVDPIERRELLQVAASQEALEDWRAELTLPDQVKLLERLRQRVQNQKGK